MFSSTYICQGNFTWNKNNRYLSKTPLMEVKMALFKKKSTSVDAINYQGQLIPLMQWLQATNIENHPEVSMRIEDTGAIHISNSLQSTSSVAHIGDWIVCSRVGCWYAISKDVFSKFYENVKEETCQ